MSSTVQYLDSYGNLISHEDLNKTKRFKKKSFTNEKIKSSESYVDGQIIGGIYYLDESESLEDLMQDLIIEKEQNWTFLIKKEEYEGFTLWDWHWYVSSKQLELKKQGMKVLDNKNRKIFYCSCDLQNKALLDNPEKYYYFNQMNDNGKEKILKFRYKINGEFEIAIDKNDSWDYAWKGLFLEDFLASPIVEDFPWNQHPYYHSAYPFLPNTPL